VTTRALRLEEVVDTVVEAVAQGAVIVLVVVAAEATRPPFAAARRNGFSYPLSLRI